MSTATCQSIRLRIRDVTDSSDALVLTSVPGGSNASSIVKSTSGDGAILRPDRAAPRAQQQYKVECADPVIAASSPPSRIITSQLFDASGRQLLLSRRTYLEVSYNLGGAWVGVIAGYLNDYSLADAITWEFAIGDTRRIENTRTVFDGTSATFAARGALFGGPIVGGPWGPINDRGGWKFVVQSVVTPTAGQASGFVRLGFVNGYKLDQ